jgi:hypothetical protein
MRFTTMTTLLMASTTFGMAVKEPQPKPRPSACTPSQPDRSVPPYGPTQTLYGQCGGKDYTGRTKCQKPFVCLKQNFTDSAAAKATLDRLSVPSPGSARSRRTTITTRNACRSCEMERNFIHRGHSAATRQLPDHCTGAAHTQIEPVAHVVTGPRSL